MKKEVTNKAGKKQTVWVKASPGDAPKPAAAAGETPDPPPAREFGRNTFATLPSHSDAFDAGTGRLAGDVQSHAAAGVAAMTAASRAAIADYTGEGYAALNGRMRDCPPAFGCLNAAAKGSLDAIEAGIAAAGPLPRPVAAYRAIDAKTPAAAAALVDGFRDAKDFGGPVTLPSLTSTSLSRDTAEGFGGPSALVYHIRAKSGLYVDSISATKGENELLLSSKSSYRVVNVVSQPGKPHLIELAEV